ncbi:MAG: DNA-binding protein [Paracoccus sp. (in: a-proteobacteria)]|nr:DNA-binding protein [Paracoccus sp. (in: a-proteobacteria)]
MTDASIEPAGTLPGIILQNPHVAVVVQKRDFIDRVIASSGARKAIARPIIEATLAELGRVLSDGQTLAVPPLGRARISLEKDARGGDVITLRLRRRPAKPD